MKRRFDGSALVWGLLFAMIAAIGIWLGLGHDVDWPVLRVAAPAVLIGLGILGLALSVRSSNRSSTPHSSSPHSFQNLK